jgi:predicted nucleic acid-binding protein
MISLDANLLLFAYGKTSPFHVRAQAFLSSLSRRSDVAISEFVLTEFYLHLRNPAVFARPLGPAEAVQVVDSYRRHPRWRVLGFPPHSREIHASLWTHAGSPGFARRRIYDVRTALCLQGFGVTEFATANVKDFLGLGFERVWNPLEE